MGLAPTISAAGIEAPTYPEILASLQASYRLIYGADVYLEADSQDGQFLALIASAIHDTNSAAIAVYNAFSPATAQGEGLSRVVKINGLRRASPSRSSVDLRIVGQAGTVITNGVVRDALDQRWLLPASVTIPLAGEITVTATAEQLGAITALPNTVTTIATPTRGWQTVTNLAAAVPGAPVEADAALRRRQARSTSLPSVTILGGLIGAISALSGVTRMAAYENDTGAIDANGIPARTIAMVVEGGAGSAIAAEILKRKTLGTGTFGSSMVTVNDAAGVPRVVRFARPIGVTVQVEVSLTAFAGYTTLVGEAIQAAVAAHLNGLGIGDDALRGRIWSAATLPGDARGATFDVTQIRLRRGADPLAAGNVAIAWNEAAQCTAADVTLVVT
jgi:uncharacterized phage protein gp47/JayE